MDHPADTTHPVLACARELAATLKTVHGVEPVFMSTADKQAALIELTRVVDQVAELRGRVLACAEDVAAEHGARDAATWLSHTARVGPAARRWRAQAHSQERWTQVGDSVRDGRVNLEQAQVITHALDQLSTDLDPDLLGQCEARLITEAATFGPRALRVLGRKILDVVDPYTAESREAAALDKQERQAQHKTFLRWRRNGDGTTDLTGRVADPVFDRLMTYLDAFTNPRRTHTDSPAHSPADSPASGTGNSPADSPAGAGTDPGAPTRTPTGPTGATGAAGPTGATGSSPSPDDRRPYDQRLGAALGAFLEAVDPARLPLHGGDATTVIVTIDFETLRGRLQTTHGHNAVALIGDEPITAAQARRLACTAKILPAVLGGASELLDLGRARRLASPAQRKALALRHPTCQAAGCQIPSAWCEAHHRRPWSTGGNTNLEDLALLCSFHHHLAHDAHYELRHHPDGHIGFHRRH